jgi:demethylspheroidene O-methyltransferase
MAKHNMLLYQDLMRPVELLSRPPGVQTAVGSFFPYAETAQPDKIDAERSGTYSALMSDTIAPIADDIIASGALDGCRVLLDVGGGNGQFLEEAGTRLPSLEQLRLFDLPSVVERASARFRESPLASRFNPTPGDFHDGELPSGNDAVTLIRILLDHEEQKGRALLRKVRASLKPGGRLIVAEPMKGIPGSADRTADVYFSFYLYAMGRGRSRHVDQLRAMLHDAGFSRVRRVRETYPVFASILVAEQ